MFKGISAEQCRKWAQFIAGLKQSPLWSMVMQHHTGFSSSRAGGFIIQAGGMMQIFMICQNNGPEEHSSVKKKKL